MKLCLHCLVRIDGVVLDLARGLLYLYRMFLNSVLILMVLVAFAKFRKATMSLRLSICSSVCMEQFGSHWMYFHEIWYLSIFRKSTEKIQVRYMKTNVHF
jgi:hypothetical protein